MGFWIPVLAALAMGGLGFGLGSATSAGDKVTVEEGGTYIDEPDAIVTAEEGANVSVTDNSTGAAGAGTQLGDMMNMLMQMLPLLLLGGLF